MRPSVYGRKHAQYTSRGRHTYPCSSCPGTVRRIFVSVFAGSGCLFLPLTLQSGVCVARDVLCYFISDEQPQCASPACDAFDPAQLSSSQGQNIGWVPATPGGSVRQSLCDDSGTSASAHDTRTGISWRLHGSVIAKHEPKRGINCASHVLWIILHIYLGGHAKLELALQTRIGISEGRSLVEVRPMRST